jgi:predicted nucleic acid-binding protein
VLADPDEILTSQATIAAAGQEFAASEPRSLTLKGVSCVQPMGLGLVDTVDSFIAEIGVRVVPVDRSIPRQAASLRATHVSMRLPDALALATAMAHETKLLTLDTRLRRVIDKLVNGDE